MTTKPDSINIFGDTFMLEYVGVPIKPSKKRLYRAISTLKGEDFAAHFLTNNRGFCSEKIVSHISLTHTLEEEQEYPWIIKKYKDRYAYDLAHSTAATPFSEDEGKVWIKDLSCSLKKYCDRVAYIEVKENRYLKLIYYPIHASTI
jgi:hypothetical protein